MPGVVLGEPEGRQFLSFLVEGAPPGVQGVLEGLVVLYLKEIEKKNHNFKSRNLHFWSN